MESDKSLPKYVTLSNASPFRWPTYEVDVYGVIASPGVQQVMGGAVWSSPVFTPTRAQSSSQQPSKRSADES